VQRLSLEECFKQIKLKSSDEVRAVLSNFRGINLFSKFWKSYVKRYTALRRWWRRIWWIHCRSNGRVH